MLSKSDVKELGQALRLEMQGMKEELRLEMRGMKGTLRIHGWALTVIVGGIVALIGKAFFAG